MKTYIYDTIAGIEVKRLKLTKKTKVHNTLYVIKCPICNGFAASASELSILPNWATCNKCFEPIKK